MTRPPVPVPRSTDTPLRVRIVLKDRGWIMGKIAIRLVFHFNNHKVEADIALLPTAEVDLNHFFIYIDYDIKSEIPTKSTPSVTHIDSLKKLLVLKMNLKRVDRGICISRMSVEELASQGIDRRRLCCINLAHDGLLRPRRITIGLTAPLSGMPQEGEPILQELAEMTRLDGFCFKVSQGGWAFIDPRLLAASASVAFTGNDLDHAVTQGALLSLDQGLNSKGRYHSTSWMLSHRDHDNHEPHATLPILVANQMFPLKETVEMTSITAFLKGLLSGLTCIGHAMVAQ